MPSHTSRKTWLRVSKVSTQWRQGMGYLTALDRKKGDLQKAAEQFLDQTEAPENNRDLIWDISRLDLFGSQIDPFLFLHRLNVCALAQDKINRSPDSKSPASLHSNAVGCTLIPTCR